LKHGSFLLCAKGSHMSMWDDQDTYGAGLVKWLKAIDAGQRALKF
jgi:proline iminopeptidase